ncbi:two-component system, NtrC family, response regulator [Deferribacter desulfuricans SSM1]|uniref:Two-component system, NtrC family, response regulator n=1 Tax=Deferribacter desulfuricans (strain DSM 14783 / JCM 11476 / NBRC 101012 / SSM1) TaxID=639282 RepID=D3PE14_DEFDS|nr:sigma-54 dependent transcriptional regulator [Deferribacter desulfuricans]BAI80837.1 two-component system, NtrC family, response regulator [Deferribacter desulfuricans SSM1]
MFSIVVIDDEKYTLDFFEALFLDDEDIKVYKFQSPIEAIDNIDKIYPDVIITDILMSEMSGLEVLDYILKEYPDITVVLMTAYASIEKAVEAIKKGAFDFITKPFEDLEEVSVRIKKAIENSRLKTEVKVLQENIREIYGIENIVAKSKKMMDILSLVKKVSKINSNILITGESGTGKELIARSIHDLSDRKNERFLPVNCAAIPENLYESLFFGYEKGAFTGAYSNKKGYFEEANNGTIFLDEITETNPSFQAKLLRVIQERTIKRLGSSEIINVNVRIIAATNKNLKDEVEKGYFREDLYYRLNVINIEIPPLRERKEDIPLLIEYFTKKYSKEFGKSIKKISSEFYKFCYEYSWPGNVRELENTVERCVALEDSDILSVRYIPENMKQYNKQGVKPYKKARDEFEKNYLLELLSLTDNKISEAAKIAQIDVSTLHRKIQKYLSK